MNVYEQKLINRLKRIEGQVRGVQKMMSEQRNCQEVIGQLSAIRSATDKLIINIVADNLQHCVMQDIEQGQDIKETMNEALKLMINSR